MVDLLEILRTPDNWEARWFNKSWGTPSSAPFEAADEIERLRAIIAVAITDLRNRNPQSALDGLVLSGATEQNAVSNETATTMATSRAKSDH